ncbi:translation elongation factor Ts [Pseudovibrio sp. Tun.PSC04-5.I4]|uniref:translation elongation factor Ts n=1 Tax=Pseudovibrio sp. Tun.PSC04-5.I4 TaxID=1798213 RepID=UPI00087FD595|nr:translation elongation factor Ts [Pseudovibrio sp. Tun.PSC04-5.I4]SDR07264.1 translation elongation factor Ts (EF-Ts) [Pseudovibrio sp. Tun.PSC04-5.I4]
MSITAAMVKELREISGAGMMDCKAALKETGGEMEAAVDWLRTKGLAKAAKKAGRVAAEGLVAVVTAGNKAVVVEVNSETDFVARNDNFQKLVRDIAATALTVDGDVVKLAAAPYPGSDKTVEGEITKAVGTIGENMSLRRSTGLSVSEGVVASYVHNAVSDGLGKIGVLVALESAGDADKLVALGKQIAMHVAATNPMALNTDVLDADAVERERAVYVEQARESGKPDSIIEKMVEGRLRKFYEEVTLVKQSFVINPDLTVEKAVEEAAKEIGSPVKLTGFVRIALGEGIKKEETDFAAEVAAAAGN